MYDFFFVVFSSPIYSEWILFTQDEHGKSFWYENKRIKKVNENFYVWLRIRFPTKNELGVHALISFLKINCSEYSVKNLQSIFFKDYNWINQISILKRDSKKTLSLPYEITVILKNKICK